MKAYAPRTLILRSMLIWVMIMAYSFAGYAAFIKPPPAALAPILQNALTDPALFPTSTPRKRTQHPVYVLLTEDHAPNDGRTGLDKKDRRPPPPSKKQGVAFLIAGSICLGAGIALTAYGIQQSRQGDPRYTDWGSILAIAGGVILDIIGLSLAIPGLVFVLKY